MTFLDSLVIKASAALPCHRLNQGQETILGRNGRLLYCQNLAFCNQFY